jgi:hypothetical protein
MWMEASLQVGRLASGTTARAEIKNHLPDKEHKQGTMVSDMGRVTKIEKLPPDISSDCRMDASIMGPRMKANGRGPASILSLRRTYPRTPNAIKAYRSKAWFAML